MADSDVARDEHATKRGAKVLQHPGTSWGIRIISSDIFRYPQKVSVFFAAKPTCHGLLQYIPGTWNIQL